MTAGPALMAAPLRWLTAWLAVLPRQLAAIGGGVLLFLSFPPRTWWYLAPLGIALLIGAIVWPSRDRPVSLLGGFGYGYLGGLAFLGPLLPWVGVYVGAVPWLALAAAEAVFTGLFGLAVVVVNRYRVGGDWVTVIALAAWWSATEWLRSSVPFGGFPWGRLAFGQPDGPLVALAALGGAPLLSFGVALIGAGLIMLVLAAGDLTRGQVGAGTVAGIVVVTAAAPIAALVTKPTLSGMEGDDTMTVAAVQGNVPRMGLDFNAQRRAVLDMHVARTEQLAREIDQGLVERPEVVVWPENSADIDPLRNPDAHDEISRAAQAVGAPILVGAVLVNDDGTTTNSVISWDPESGPGDQHDKEFIQPFGEYLPMRDFFALFSDYADDAGNFVPGYDDGVVDADGLPVAVATCYEVAFDPALRDAVDGGGRFLAIPTNNATFGDTEMTYQQLAMSQVRAVEHDRAAVVAATSGVSAIIAPNGDVTAETAMFEPAALVETIPLRDSRTVATRLGPWPEYVLIGLAVGLAGAGIAASRHR